MAITIPQDFDPHAAEAMLKQLLPPGAVKDPLTSFNPEEIYNLICRVVERVGQKRHGTGHYPELLEKLRPRFKQAATFLFDAQEYRVALAVAMEELQEADFFMPPAMPFDTTLLLDPVSAVLLTDVQDYPLGEERPNAEEQKALASVHEMDSTPTVLRRGSAYVFARNVHPDGEHDWTLCLGYFSLLSPTPGFEQGFPSIITFPRLMSGLGDPLADGPLLDIDSDTAGKLANPGFPLTPEQMYQQTFGHFSTSVNTAIDQLAYIDLPRHHIIRESRQLSPREERQLAKGIHLPRFNQVPKYRLVEPEKIKFIYPEGDGEGTGARTVTPHGRRGHTKYLTAARYTNKRWCRIRVRPSWAGSEEWEFNKLRYKVIKHTKE